MNPRVPSCSLNRIFFAAILLLLLLASCVGTNSTETTLVYGLTLAPSGIDPHINASAELGIPLRSVYDSLVFLDSGTGLAVPGLAKHWTISEDGLTYTFELREDVVFHDGELFNAQAVKANIDYIIDPDHHSQKAASMLGPLLRVEVNDEFTVSFHLGESFSPLLDSLSQVYLGMASPKALSDWGPQDYQFHQVGTGPYQFVEYIPNDHLTLQRNPDYAWGPTIYHQSKASIDVIRFQFYEDSATRAIALENGGVDILGEIPPHDALRLTSDNEFVLHPVSIPGLPLQFLFNTKLDPTSDVRVRQALVASVDRESIVSVVFGGLSPVAQGPLSAAHYNLITSGEEMQFNPTLAAKLLDEAGWQYEGDSEIRSRQTIPLTLHIVAPIWGSNPEVAQLIEVYWESIGAQVELEIAPGFGPLKEIQTDGEYHAIGFNFFGTDPDLLSLFYGSEGLYNWSGYENPELDDLLADAVHSFNDASIRRSMYNEVSDKILEEALFLPIRDYVNLVISNSRVRDLHFTAQGWFPILIDLRLAP